MSIIEDLRDQFTAASISLDGIATDIQALKDLLAAGDPNGLNAADTAEALALATSLAARTASIDSQTP
jgi:hypothetical protein